MASVTDSIGSIAALAVNLTFAAGAILAVYIFGLIIYRLTLHPLARYPGPLLAGITNLYAVYHAYIGDVHLDMLMCHERYGGCVRYGPHKVIFNTNTAVQDIYGRSANVQKSTAYRAFETSRTAHDTQSTINKVAHAHKRRVISQAFSDSAIRSFENHILEHVDVFIAYLTSTDESADESEKVLWSPSANMAQLCSRVSFDLMAELVFGKAFHMLDVADNRFIIELIQVAAFRVGVCLQMPILAAWNIDKIFTPNVRKLRDQYVSVSRALAVDRMNLNSKRQDLFSHILAARDPQTGQGFTMDEIWGESTLLIVAGSDAISTGMAGCFYYLSRHHEAYAKACVEVRSTFSSANDIRNGQKLNSCLYLHACIDEALRMSPPVGGALWREICQKGVNIDGHIIPQGYDVGVGIYAIQHNPVYYPDPFQYKPERWIVGEDNTKESVHLARSAFSAFSTGPVGCVGKNLAYLELRVTIAKVLWTLDMKNTIGSLPEKPKLKYLSRYKDHCENEYWLRDRFTSWKDGPMMSFRVRQT